MLNKTVIEWTGATWNPITGCLKRCAYCYALRQATRFHQDFSPAFHPERLLDPLDAVDPKKIFVCSMSDIVGKGVRHSWVQQIIDHMSLTPQHTFQLLTKCPENYKHFQWPSNTWLGATATDQQMWKKAEQELRELSRRGHETFISSEPLLAPIKPTGWMPDHLIIGSLSGYKPFRPPEEWVQCLAHAAKQEGTHLHKRPSLEEKASSRNSCSSKSRSKK